MVVPAAREDPFLRQFDLRRHKIPAADGTLHIMCVRDVDTLAARITPEQYARDGQLPYWGDVWPGSVAIARALLRGPSLAGKRALDLGCGVGTAGVAAGRKGAHVVFADYDARALPFAAFNARHNGARNFETVRFDWNRDRLPGHFDLILCADVVYEQRHHAPILDQIAAALGPEGVAMVADPYRVQAEGFFTLACARFRLEQEDTDVHFEEVRRRLRIVRLSRPAGPPSTTS